MSGSSDFHSQLTISEEQIFWRTGHHQMSFILWYTIYIFTSILHPYFVARMFYFVFPWTHMLKVACWAVTSTCITTFNTKCMYRVDKTGFKVHHYQQQMSHISYFNLPKWTHNIMQYCGSIVYLFQTTNNPQNNEWNDNKLASTCTIACVITHPGGEGSHPVVRWGVAGQTAWGHPGGETIDSGALSQGAPRVTL